MSTETCPCGSNTSYQDCCGRFIEHRALPATAEELMRSRYTAFTQNNFDYLDETSHTEASQPNDTQSNRDLISNFKWVGLEIVQKEMGTESDVEGYVDFIARYQAGNNEHAIREKSLFKKDGDRWLYVNGKSLALPKKNTPKVGRNDPCPCGSGKKYKKCCGVK